jgi:hypothetical protein
MNQKIQRFLCWLFCTLFSLSCFGTVIFYSNQLLDCSGEAAASYIREEQRQKGNYGVHARISLDSFPYGNFSGMRKTLSESFGSSYPKEQKGLYFIPNNLFSPLSINFSGQTISVSGLSSCQITGGSPSVFDFSYIGSTKTFFEDGSIFISEALAKKFLGRDDGLDALVGSSVLAAFSTDDSKIEQTLAIAGIIKENDSTNHFVTLLNSDEFVFFPILSLTQSQHLNSVSFFVFFGEDIFEISHWYSSAYSFSLSNPHLQFGFYSQKGSTFEISDINLKIQETTSNYKTLNKWYPFLVCTLVIVSFVAVLLLQIVYRRLFKKISYSFYFSSIFGGLLLAIAISLIVYQFFFFTNLPCYGISRSMALYLLIIPILSLLFAKNVCNDN